MTNELQTPLTNAQLDLLKMFSRDVDDRHWIEIKRLITRYFADKAGRAMRFGGSGAGPIRQ